MSDVPSDPPEVLAPPPEPVSAESDGRSNRTVLILAGALAVVVVILVAVVAVSMGGDDDEAASDEAAEEVFLEPVDHLQDPFTPPVGKGAATVATTTSTSAAPTTTTTLATKSAVASEAGGVPGLYGGTRDKASCDKEKLIAFLGDNPEKGQAWADTLGIEREDIRTFVEGLTPVILRSDTRVTNHGYKSGRATSIQSVLQAGTAILVDEYGKPVVKCFCGNPLTDPVPTKARYTGTEWEGFDPGRITVVVQNTVVINNFILVDNTSGDLFDRPATTDGTEDDDFDVDDLPPDDDFDPNMCEGPAANPDLCVDLDATTTTAPPQAPLDELLSGSYTVQGTTDAPPDVCTSGELTVEMQVTGSDGAWNVDVVLPGGTLPATLEEGQLAFEGSLASQGASNTVSGRFFVDGSAVTFEATFVAVGGGANCTLALSGTKV